MTPRQRVLTALSHKQPDRVPFSWGFGPTREREIVLRSELKARGIDWDKLFALCAEIVRINPPYVGPENRDNYVSLWGIGTKEVQYQGGAYGEFTGFPLAGMENPAELDSNSWPEISWYKFETLRQTIENANGKRHRAVQIFAGNPFEIYSWMTGLEETMINLMDNRELVVAALERITDFFIKRTQGMLRAAGDLVDIVFMGDDLGGQTGLLISREAYRDVVQPFHRRIINAVRELAPHARCMFHTDGSVFDIIPDLLDAGIDVLEAVQIETAGMDPQRLKSAYGSRLSFHGAISVQQLLPHGTTEEVARQCKNLIRIFGESGGYIAAPSHAIQVGTPSQNILAMLEAVLGDEYREQILPQSQLGQ